MATRKPPAPAWRPGTSGNPAGRPPGTGAVAKLRAAIEQEIPEILQSLVAAAKSGDTQAARILVERVIPAVKPQEQPQALALPTAGNLTEQGRAVLQAVADGTLAPGQGSQMVGAIASLARVTEIDELAARVAALEGKSHANT